MHFEGLSSVRLYRVLQVKCRTSFSLYSSASWRTWPFSITGGKHFSSAGENKSWYHEQSPSWDWLKVNLWFCGLIASSGHHCSRGFGTIRRSTEWLLDTWQKRSPSLKMPFRPSSVPFCTPYRCILGLFHSTLPLHCSRSHWDLPGCQTWICSWIEERCHRLLLLGHRSPTRLCSH